MVVDEPLGSAASTTTGGGQRHAQPGRSPPRLSRRLRCSARVVAARACLEHACPSADEETAEAAIGRLLARCSFAHPRNLVFLLRPSPRPGGTLGVGAANRLRTCGGSPSRRWC